MMNNHNSLAHTLRSVVVFIGLVVSAAANSAQQHIKQAKQYLEAGDTKAAASLIDDVIDSEPTNAEAHYTAGLVYGQRAQEASFVFAAGLARRSLNAFKEAVKLQPGNIDYRLGLMGYYFQAPAIAGGNQKLGVQQVNAIKKLDAGKGYLATAMMYQQTGQQDELDELYESPPAMMLEDADFMLQRAMHRQSQQRYSEALNDFKTVLALSENDEQDLNHFLALYQIGRSGVLAEDFLNQSDQAMTSYIATAPQHRTLPSKAWAKFRLAQIKLLNGDKSSAINLYHQAGREADESDLRAAMKKAQKMFQ